MKKRTEKHNRKISEAKKGKPQPIGTRRALLARWRTDRFKRLEHYRNTCSDTQRARTIMNFMAMNKSFSEIGKEMGISKQRVSQILKKDCS